MVSYLQLLWRKQDLTKFDMEPSSCLIIKDTKLSANPERKRQDAGRAQGKAKVLKAT